MDYNRFLTDIARKRDKRFSALENFRLNFERKRRYGVAPFECDDAINEACDFFGIPAPAFVKDLTDHPRGRTMVRNHNPFSYADDELSYNMNQLTQLGINTKDAFSLVITHECAHRVLQDIIFEGKNEGSWEEELCCDFFMGVRAAMDKMSLQAIDAVRRGLGSSPGCDTHPTGRLRYEVITYGWTMVGNFDLIHHRRRSFNEYMVLFMDWLDKHDEVIRREQLPFF